jgi:hypothetical protein
LSSGFAKFGFGSRLRRFQAFSISHFPKFVSLAGRAAAERQRILRLPGAMVNRILGWARGRETCVRLAEIEI